MEVLTQGIETAEQLARLRASDCLSRSVAAVATRQ